TRAVSKIVMTMQDCLFLGNLSAMRDWGHAKDYVRAMHAILQQDEPSDYVIATGVTTTVRDFVMLSFAEVGVTVSFKGNGVDEKGYIAAVDEHKLAKEVGAEFVPNVKALLGKSVVEVDPAYFRPTEVELLIGDATKSQEVLGWTPEYSLKDLVADMMKHDVKLMKKEEYLKRGGYKTLNYFE
ncbi:MAG: GDP-mannose 4,6-dehydratase, partial [Tannerellaceae bacterium]